MNCSKEEVVTTSWSAFEEEVAQLYRVLGASVRQNVNLSGFQIDIYVEETTPSGQRIRFGVDCKSHNKKVGNKIVNDFARVVQTLKEHGLIDKGTIVSKTGFSQDAHLVSQTTGIVLLHLKDLRLATQLAKKPPEKLYDLSMLTTEERDMAKRYRLEEFFEKNGMYLLFVVKIKDAANRFFLKGTQTDLTESTFIKMTQSYLEESLKGSQSLSQHISSIHAEVMGDTKIPPEDWKRLCNISSKMIVWWGWI